MNVKQVLYPLMFVLGLAITVTNSWGSDVVTATNAGTATFGDILWYSDPNPGHPTATYALPSSIPGLTGAQGAAGTNGIDGANGLNGVDGAIGAAGEKGEQGVKGDKGTKGDTGAQGVAGHNAEAPAIDPRLDVEVREYDSQHWSMSSYASFALQTGTARYIVGQRLTLKLGKSFEEKELQRLRQELMGRNVIVLPE